MKITTWNVNGVRAWLKKDAIAWIHDYQPDIFCLQEIKGRPDQLTEEQHAVFDPYIAQWNPAERPGYSGTATFVRGLEVEHENGFQHPIFDIEGRMTQTRWGDLVLMNGYFPNGSRDHSRVPYKLDFYDKLLKLAGKYRKAGKGLIITGDFNTAHNDIDLKNHKANHNKTTGYLDVERVWIDKYLENGFVDAFRNLYPDREQYSWWSAVGSARAKNVGWRLDYFLVSEPLMDRVEDVIIHDDVMGSDHCPVTLILKD